MQNIIFILLLSFGLAYADTVGLPEKSWVEVPTEIVQSTVDDESVIGEEYVLETAKMDVPTEIVQSTVNNESVIGEEYVLQTPKSETGFTEEGKEKYRKMILDFVNPLWFFIRDFPAVFGTFVVTLLSLFYIFFYRPLAKRVRSSDEEDILIPQAMLEKERAKEALVSESAIMSQREYSSLYGLMNENFIYEKERVLLDTEIEQEERNRKVISLEWKFNQILHFALPKLSTTDPKRFKEGVKELLEEEISRDIMIIALEDIIKKEIFTPEDKASMESMLALFLKPQRRQSEAVNHRQKKGMNYSNYMME